MIRATARGVEIDVRVIPRAQRTQLSGERDGRLLIRLSAPPVEGAANAALIEFLSDLLKVRRGAVRIASGERSREKRVEIDGVSLETAVARLG